MGLTLLLDELSEAESSSEKKNECAGEETARESTTRNDGMVDAATVHEWKDLTADIMDNTTTAVDTLSDLLNYDKIQVRGVEIFSVSHSWVARILIESTHDYVCFLYIVDGIIQTGTFDSTHLEPGRRVCSRVSATGKKEGGRFTA